MQYYDIPKDLVPGPRTPAVPGARPPPYHVSMSNINVRININANTSNLHSIPFWPVFRSKSIANLLDFLASNMATFEGILGLIGSELITRCEYKFFRLGKHILAVYT